MLCDATTRVPMSRDESFQIELKYKCLCMWRRWQQDDQYRRVFTMEVKAFTSSLDRGDSVWVWVS